MYYEDFLTVKPGDFLTHPNGLALVVVIAEQFWMKKAGVENIRMRKKIGDCAVMFRYLGLKIESKRLTVPQSESVQIRGYGVLHHAELITTGVNAETILVLSEVLTFIGREQVGIIRSDLRSIINKAPFWEKAFRSD